MSILREIQATILNETSSLASVLLKLRFLASRLGSEPLEEWVRHESEGYPAGSDVPPYRVLAITYKGSWSGPFGSGVQNAPIAPYLIEKLAGASWTQHKVRQSIGVVEELATAENLGIDASNLILLLQGKVYPTMACNSVEGTISTAAMSEILHSVRSRVLELTLELEKRLPAAVEVTLQMPAQSEIATDPAVTQIFHQTIHGNVTHVTATGNSSVSLLITAGDVNSLSSELMKAGLPEEDAKEFSRIVAAETPEGPDKPFGKRALAWIGENAPKAASGAWKIGSSVATNVLTEAAMKYYGLKP